MAGATLKGHRPRLSWNPDHVQKLNQKSAHQASQPTLHASRSDTGTSRRPIPVFVKNSRGGKQILNLRRLFSLTWGLDINK